MLGHRVQRRRGLRGGRRQRPAHMSVQPQLHRGTGIVLLNLLHLYLLLLRLASLSL